MEENEEMKMSEQSKLFESIMENENKHIEEFAAAFIQETGLDPTKVKMVTQIKGDLSHVLWFEPFPEGSEIEIYRKRAEKSERELAELREQTKWIPTSERLPEMGERVIVTEGKSVCEGKRERDLLKGYAWVTIDRFLLRNITHWIPLPHPPEVE